MSKARTGAIERIARLALALAVLILTVAPSFSSSGVATASPLQQAQPQWDGVKQASDVANDGSNTSQDQGAPVSATTDQTSNPASAGSAQPKSTSLLAGDANNDGCVNSADFGLLKAAFGSAPGDANWFPGADFNGDNVVTTADFQALLRNYGSCAGNTGDTGASKSTDQQADPSSDTNTQLGLSSKGGPLAPRTATPTRTISPTRDSHEHADHNTHSNGN